jgi:hypothetical protein
LSLTWQRAIEIVRPFVVRIVTPKGTGTGFLVSRSTTKPVLGVATAAHVVDYAYRWEQPIRIEHAMSGKSIFLRAEDRAVVLDEDRDTAAIVFVNNETIPFPPDPPSLLPEDKRLRLGVEVGWLGFPAVSPANLCFFSGRTSCQIVGDHAYLVDGVAINGVSGGPTFALVDEDVLLIGVVAAYLANRAKGRTLPGLSVIRDVSQFQELVRHFHSVDDAKRSEADRRGPPPPSSPIGGIGASS